MSQACLAASSSGTRAWRIVSGSTMARLVNPPGLSPRRRPRSTAKPARDLTDVGFGKDSFRYNPNRAKLVHDLAASLLVDTAVLRRTCYVSIATTYIHSSPRRGLCSREEDTLPWARTRSRAAGSQHYDLISRRVTRLCPFCLLVPAMAYAGTCANRPCQW